MSVKYGTFRICRAPTRTPEGQSTTVFLELVELHLSEVPLELNAQILKIYVYLSLNLPMDTGSADSRVTDSSPVRNTLIFLPHFK